MKNTVKTLTMSLVIVALAIVSTLTLPARQVMAASIDIGAYSDQYFYGRSQPEPLCLQLDADTISVCATCEVEGETDNLACHIVALDGGTFSATFNFDADGTVTTIPYAFPAGNYKVYFTGSDYVQKHLAIVVFTRIE